MEFLGNCFGVLITFIFPFAFEAIGWKFYMINAAWDVLQVIFVAVFWVETNGLTLEQIDDIFLRRRGQRRVIEGSKLEGDEEVSTIEETIKTKK